jgi:hypothetical protein
MKKATIFFLAVILLAACSKTIQEPDNLQNPAEEATQKGKPAPPANANPVFAFTKTYFTKNALQHYAGITVADENGANETKVYSKTTQPVSHPAWNETGTKLCFTADNANLYTLNISLNNGVPTGSGATKIADGIAAGGQYKQGKWRHGASQIASVWKKTGETDKIHILPASGGTASVLYAAANSDWTIGDDISFNPEGSKLVFIERQVSTDQNFLKVFDLNSNTVINTIDLSQFKSVFELDWGKTAETNMVAILTIPRCDGSYTGNQGINQLYTIDVSSPTPLLTWRKDDAGHNLSISPNDLKFTVKDYSSSPVCSPTTGCCTRSYYSYGFKTFSFTNPSISITDFDSNPIRINPDWKR